MDINLDAAIEFMAGHARRLNRRRLDHLLGRRAPDSVDADRIALANATIGVTPADLAELAAELPTLPVPVRAVYGERDRLLPDISDTMTRLPRDVPQAKVTALPDAGPFLQLEQPDRVAYLPAGFLAPGARDADEATIGKAKA